MIDKLLPHMTEEQRADFAQHLENHRTLERIHADIELQRAKVRWQLRKVTMALVAAQDANKRRDFQTEAYHRILHRQLVEEGHAMTRVLEHHKTRANKHVVEVWEPHRAKVAAFLAPLAEKHGGKK